MERVLPERRVHLVRLDPLVRPAEAAVTEVVAEVAEEAVMEAVTAEVAEVEEAVPPAAAALPQEAAAVEAEDQCADKQKRMVIEPSFFAVSY